MNNLFKHYSVAALIFSAASSAFAADSADLKVQGTLIMGSCTPTLTSDGVVDYGKISLSSMSATDVNQLGTKEITLTLTCQTPTKAGWSITDNRADSVIDTQPQMEGNPIPGTVDEFGLGTTVAGVRLGSYGINAANNGDPLIDGKQGYIGVSDDNGMTWGAAANGGVYSHGDGARLITFSDADGQPVEFTTASDILKVGASVQDTTTLAITDDTLLDGLATISVKYL
ncbi:DUF1120 domain-containing protein [Lelliottia wanjuensis]|uniref:DUF1120 domain-containing protein n=1 Tax=Lelliottia wanjuensis TaxID=3050585 RepID=UPI00254EA591|nr:DUF1120 domain-containing protein [Lelliottia sp. V104_15]MDK9607138.1 DUF1120 domain-containing protein [Lelliottia sp. V104_15]